MKRLLAWLGTGALGCALLGCAVPAGIASAAGSDPDWCTKADVIRLDGEQTEQVIAYKNAPKVFLCGSVMEKTGNRLWASTFTGGPTEPHVDNFIYLKYSDDDGVTWNDFLAVDNLTYPDTTRELDDDLWVDPSGRLWLFYNQTAAVWAPAGVLPSTAHFAVIIDNPTADPSEFNITRTDMLFGGQSRMRPLVISLPGGGTQWLKAAHMNWTEYTDIMASDDEGATWYQKGRAHGTACGAHENSMVELSDGTLMLIKRIDSGIGGGLEVSYSGDKGATWSEYESNLPRPLRSPGSKTVMIRLNSGHLLLITNDTNNGATPSAARDRMTAFLSEDDGMTWRYSLVLDGRNDVSYPDAFQDEDGTIYATWDKGRTIYCETRFCTFTEEDIKRGSFSEDDIQMRPIFKGPQFNDIVSFSRFGGIPSAFPLGTEHDVVAYSQLQTITVTLTDGSEYDITGSWACENYNANVPGDYWFYFTPDSLPARAEDVQKVLKVKISILDTSEPVAVSLEVTPPTKTAYRVGEEFDPAGLTVKAVLSDGGKRTLASGDYTLSGFDSSTAGSKTVTVTYGTLTGTFTVTVSPAETSGGDAPAEEGGCGSAVSVAGGMMLALAALAGVAVIVKTTKSRGE